MDSPVKARTIKNTLLGVSGSAIPNAQEPASKLKLMRVKLNEQWDNNVVPFLEKLQRSFNEWIENAKKNEQVVVEPAAQTEAKTKDTSNQLLERVVGVFFLFALIFGGYKIISVAVGGASSLVTSSGIPPIEIDPVFNSYFNLKNWTRKWSQECTVQIEALQPLRTGYYGVIVFYDKDNVKIDEHIIRITSSLRKGEIVEHSVFGDTDRAVRLKLERRDFVW